MKRHSRDEIIRALGLQTHRRSEFDLLLILERLQSEDLIGEDREFALSELFSQYLEVQRIRAGLRPGRDRLAILDLYRSNAEDWLGWIDGKDSLASGLQEIIAECNKPDFEHIKRIAEALADFERRRISGEQTRRANQPRKRNPFNQIIYDELAKKWPEGLSEPEFIEILKGMEGTSIVRQVGPVNIELDDPDTGYFDDIPISGVRRRLTDMRKQIAADKSQEPARVN